DDAHAELLPRCADINLERDHISAKSEPSQHFERVGFRHDVETEIASRNDFVQNLPSAEALIGQCERLADTVRQPKRLFRGKGMVVSHNR
ncbi:hypothetical protein, partial [Stenotrophomonas sp. GbtcB23]|uniref:hypothetical protein n=1 Tax=Stenotrophomonas sp. GbtcB23 TaxID=2824768 RepID=UPI0020C6F67D